MAGHTSPNKAIRNAVKILLDGHATITETVYKTVVNPNTPMPYFAIGLINNNDESNKTSWGDRSTITIHAWSALALADECEDMIDNAKEALTEDVHFAIAGFNHAATIVTNQLTFPSVDSFGGSDVNQEAWHGILDVLIITTGNER